MSETESLASILAPANSTAPVQTEAVAETPTETKPETAAAETADTSRDDKGRFTKAPDAPAAAVANDRPRQDETIPLAAFMAERSRRKAAEARVAEQPQTAKVSVFDDEDKAVGQRVDERLNPFREELVEMKGQFIETMRGMLKGIHTDYDEAEKAFLTAAQGDPALADQWWKSPNPAQFAYEAGKLRMQLEAAGGDITKIGEVQTAKVREELSKAQEQIKALTVERDALKAQSEAVSNIPTSLNKTASATPVAGSADPQSLGSIVRFGNSR